MKKSKVGLCILLVMSIIYGSVMFLSSFSMAVALPTLNKIYTANRSLMPDEMFTAWERMASIPQPFYAGMAVLGLLSVVGCVLMWNLRRSGYHCLLPPAETPRRLHPPRGHSPRRRILPKIGGMISRGVRFIFVNLT